MQIRTRFDKATFAALDIFIELVDYEVSKELNMFKYPVRGKPDYYRSLLSEKLGYIDDSFGFGFGNGSLSHNCFPKIDFFKRYVQSQDMAVEVQERLIKRMETFHSTLDGYVLARKNITL